LARLRHPCVLEITEPCDDGRLAVGYATEPLLCCIDNIMTRKGSPNIVGPDGDPFELDELEIQKGLLQIAKGLQFLHQDAKLVHCNLTPASLFVNIKGDWKISGFGYHSPPNQPSRRVDPDTRLPNAGQLTFSYAAPEYVLEGKTDVANDMFSLGCVIYALFNGGDSPLLGARSEITYKDKLRSLTDLKNVPQALKPLTSLCVSKHPRDRPTAAAFQKDAYFEGMLVSTMKYLETLQEHTPEERARFLQNLQRILPQFPDRVVKRKASKYI
jgi:SCY1-like protein 2